MSWLSQLSGQDGGNSLGDLGTQLEKKTGVRAPKNYLPGVSPGLLGNIPGGIQRSMPESVRDIRSDTENQPGTPVYNEGPTIPQYPVGNGNQNDVSTGQPQQSTADQLRNARQADIRGGVTLGKEFIPEGSLGRVNAQSTPEMIAAQNAAKSIFTEGLGAPAFQAAREARLRGLNRDTQQQGQAMQAAQARGGIGGALGASQLANLQRNQGLNRQQAEQDLLLQNAAQKVGALKDWSGMAQQGEMYNLGQTAKEKMGQLGMGLAEGQMGVAERGGLTQTDIGKAMAQAMASQGGQGSKGGK